MEKELQPDLDMEPGQRQYQGVERRPYSYEDAERRPLRYQKLGEFLRSRRARLAPEQVGLPRVGRRRTPGLRREEVAYLAGIGTVWYTWLEQGRAIRASIEVLERLAEVLQLDSHERQHLFLLAHQQLPPTEAPTFYETVSPALQRFLDAQKERPAYAFDQRWDIIAWNQAACRVIGDFSLMSAQERNKLWRIFTSPELRRLLVDWEGHAQRLLAQFREISGNFVEEPWLTELVEKLNAISPEFRQWWPRYDVQGNPEGEKVLNHPLAGKMSLEYVTFQMYGTPDVKVTVYNPLDEETAEKLLYISVEEKIGQ